MNTQLLMNIIRQVSSKNNFYVRGRIYYDRTKQEIVIKEEVAKDETREYYEYYALFKNVSWTDI